MTQAVHGLLLLDYETVFHGIPGPAHNTLFYREQGFHPVIFTARPEREVADFFCSQIGTCDKWPELIAGLDPRSFLNFQGIAAARKIPLSRCIAVHADETRIRHGHGMGCAVWKFYGTADGFVTIGRLSRTGRKLRPPENMNTAIRKAGSIFAAPRGQSLSMADYRNTLVAEPFRPSEPASAPDALPLRRL